MRQKTLLACMLFASPALFASPYLTVSTSTTSRDYPIVADEPLVIPLTKDKYQLKISGIDGDCTNEYRIK
ncbi:periplasmic alpha-amylase [Vibrio variabilis]|uniref:Periplasmic alpha-amylase n=1 Tax=Vibrio variabilis TaxID=990271 RepID=A0ABQ0JMN0_9VIBR|nr:periplasmic alpha-amylase [Vibrio variabilis]